MVSGQAEFFLHILVPWMSPWSPKTTYPSLLFSSPLEKMPVFFSNFEQPLLTRLWAWPQDMVVSKTRHSPCPHKVTQVFIVPKYIYNYQLERFYKRDKIFILFWANLMWFTRIACYQAPWKPQTFWSKWKCFSLKARHGIQCNPYENPSCLSCSNCHTDPGIHMEMQRSPNSQNNSAKSDQCFSSFQNLLQGYIN